MSLPVLTKYHKTPYPYISPTRPELSQVGNTVVVAGGSTGIGLAIARGFTKAGASRVIILGRRKQVVEEAAATLQREGSSPNPSTIVEGRSVDISNLEEVSKLWSELEAEGVYVNVLVLSAAAFGNRTPILEDGLANVWSDFEINVRTTLDLTERFYKQKTGKGQKVSNHLPLKLSSSWCLRARSYRSVGFVETG
jgi:short-subunit dehydrogenase